mgnify:FL=1
MSNGVTDILKGVVGELREVAKSETVIGDPITVGDRTVIPVMKISFGFAAGGGQETDEKRGSGFGGGGGGGARVEPAAFIIIDRDEIRVLSAVKGKWDALLEAIPEVAKKIQQAAKKFRSDEKPADSSGA